MNKVYYYHLVSISECHRLWEKGEYPGHLLYGLTHLYKHGLDAIYDDIPFNPFKSRIRLMIYMLKTLVFSRKKYDAIYAVTFRGLELVIFLRALRLFKKPIAVWHHTAIVIPDNKIKRILSAFFYRGIDKMFFFSDELMNRSLLTRKVKRENTKVVHWGPDLEYYAAFNEQARDKIRFVSTGAEHRDFITLLNAFNDSKISAFCQFYIKKSQENYIRMSFDGCKLSSNIHLNFGNWSQNECTHFVDEADVVVICCLNYPYTIGLTTLVEAWALGKAVIVTDNPTFPIDVEKEGIGIKVPYGDIKSWVKAIDYLETNPEVVVKMGEKAKSLAQNFYNLNKLTEDVAETLLLLTKDCN